ncbi:MAG TPA: hypothetical protein VFW19_17830 [Allosphingosinicella sp.]|nr:hypothetical protein [Allosphingosinicella sp.]
MLTARVQLDRIEEMLAEFSRQDGTMRPLALYQAQHLAILAMLRSVGHVFDKVDAGDPARKSWARERWSRWRTEPIFRDFIDLERNRLLKEYRGGIEARDAAITNVAAVADAAYPGLTSLVVALDPTRLRASDGTNFLERIHEAIAFWRRNLAEAEAAFARLESGHE